VLTALTLKRGDTWRTTFAFSANGVPTDLSGASARLQVRDRRTKVGLCDATVDNGYVTLSGASGVVTVTVPDDVTATFPVGVHAFDLEMTWADGSVQSTETQYLSVVEDQTYGPVSGV